MSLPELDDDVLTAMASQQSLLDDLAMEALPEQTKAKNRPETLDDAWLRVKRELGEVTTELDNLKADHDEQSKVFKEFMATLDGSHPAHAPLLEVCKLLCFKEGTKKMLSVEFSNKNVKKTITLAEGLVAMADTFRIPQDYKVALERKEALMKESKVLIAKKVHEATKKLMASEEKKLKRQLERQTGERPPIKRPRSI